MNFLPENCIFLLRCAKLKAKIYITASIIFFFLIIKDEKVRDAGRVIRAGIFYEPEYRELCIQQLSSFNPDRMSLGNINLRSYKRSHMG